MEINGITQTLINRVREQIIIGELPPGQKINEMKFTNELRISRSPLREALRILENERLVTHIPRKGTFVTNLTSKDFKEVYQVREMMELYAVDLLKHMKRKDFPEIALNLRNTSSLIMPSVDDPPKEKLAYLLKTGDYHLKLVESTENRKLVLFYNTIYSNVLRYQFSYAYVSGVNHYGDKDHKDIMQCLLNGRWREAKKYLRMHIHFFFEQMETKIEESEGPHLD